MRNASLFYEEISNHNDIQNLIGTREDIFIDFEQTVSRTGKMTEDDKANFSKAASGFAHQQGGVLIWGISTTEDNNDVSRAVGLEPIVKVGSFCSALQSYIRNSTEPPVDGIEHKVIREHDNEESDTGFVVSFFPRSDGVHRALGPGRTRDRFYKRHGEGFHSLTTDEIKALFFRSLSPDLELKVNRIETNILAFLLENNGRGIAKNCSAHISLANTQSRKPVGGTWTDGEGNMYFKLAQVLAFFHPLQKYTHQIRLNHGVAVFPEEGITIARLLCGQYKVQIEYRIFSENMIPKEGTIEV